MKRSSLLVIGFLIVLPFCQPNAVEAGLVLALQARPEGNRVHGYLIDEATGALHPLAGFPRSTGGSGDGLFRTALLALDPHQQRLYAYNNQQGTMAAFRVNPLTAVATPLPHSGFPVTADFNAVNCVTVRPGGTTLIVTETPGEVRSFRVDGNQALPVTGSPFPVNAGSLTSCAFDPAGKFLFVGGGSAGSQAVGGFAIDPAGVLTAVPGSPFVTGDISPTSYVVDASRLFLANQSAGRLRVLPFDSQGVLTSATGNPFSSGLSGAHRSVAHPAGFYYVANGNGRQLGGYRITGTGAATQLTPLAGSPWLLTQQNVPALLAITASGKFLVVGDLTARRLSVLSVDPTTGVVTHRSTQPLDALGTSGGINGLVYLQGVPSPAAPVTNLKAVSLSATSARLTWKNPPPGLSPLGRVVEAKLQGQTTWTTLKIAPKASQQTTLTGLVNQGNYSFRLRTRNTAGDSAPSNVAKVKLPG